MGDKILVVDDERSIADAIAYGLYRENYIVETAYDGEEALRKIKEFRPKVVIMDVVMPKLTGYEVLKKLEDTKNMGIMLLTAKNDIVDKVLGIELGADDYVTKPFDIREVIVRVRSLIRRLPEHEDIPLHNEIVIKELKVLLPQRKVILKGELLEFTPKEFDLLAVLVKNIDRVFTRDDLLDKIWGMEYVGGTRTVDIHIQRLRKKLGEPYQDILQTVYGIGYKVAGDFYES